MNTMCIISPPPPYRLLKRERQREMNERVTGKGKGEDRGVKETGAWGSLCTARPLFALKKMEKKNEKTAVRTEQRDRK